MQEVVGYWSEHYDWRSREALLNRWDGFKTDIEGLGIHFLHIRSSNEDALPIVMTHGWPGSIVEFQKVIGALTEPGSHGGDQADAFHLVCPTLPGFGYSDKPTRPGWNIEKIAGADPFHLISVITGSNRRGSAWHRSSRSGSKHPISNSMT